MLLLSGVRGGGGSSTDPDVLFFFRPFPTKTTVASTEEIIFFFPSLILSPYCACASVAGPHRYSWFFGRSTAITFSLIPSPPAPRPSSLNYVVQWALARAYSRVLIRYTIMRSLHAPVSPAKSRPVTAVAIVVVVLSPPPQRALSDLNRKQCSAQPLLYCHFPEKCFRESLLVSAAVTIADVIYRLFGLLRQLIRTRNV